MNGLLPAIHKFNKGYEQEIPSIPIRFYSDGTKLNYKSRSAYRTITESFKPKLLTL